MKLDVVVVTYNRLEKLRESLACYESQSCTFHRLIVVNNGSNDGTKDFLDNWLLTASEKFSKEVINLTENRGGAGGFYVGQMKAMNEYCDWIYVADDDAYADSNMIRQFYEFISDNDTVGISAICAEVLEGDNEIACGHRKHIKRKHHFFLEPVYSSIDEYNSHVFDIDILSYVGAFLNARILKLCGLVNPDLFIYYDDTEHSFRLKKYGRIVCVPSIKIYHDSGLLTASNSKRCIATWREYYQTRNLIHMFKCHSKITYLNLIRRFVQDLVFHKRYRGEEAKLQFTAIKDAIFSKLGKHEVYKPGWSV